LKPALLDYLVCPVCRADLALDRTLNPRQRDSELGGGAAEIETGELVCRSGHRYPIDRGVPRLLPPNLPPASRQTAEAFGWQWQHFREMHAEYEAQFLDWIAPLPPAFFKDKLVLDAGCGMGRHAYLASRFGAKLVIGIDLSDAVFSAQANVRELPNVHIVQADIYHPPFRGALFDFIYSIGVLHHLPDPEAGFRSLLDVLKPGGTIFAWVYGAENNGVVAHVIDPVRRGLTSKLPPPVLRGIAWPLAVVLEAAVRGIYRPLKSTVMFRHLPMHDYLLSLSAFSFRQNYNIVFDHLVAPTAFYLRRQDFEAWFQRSRLREVEISWRNQNSWRGRGVLPA
jgi:SAM-dependent methyltransferase